MNIPIPVINILRLVEESDGSVERVSYGIDKILSDIDLYDIIPVTAHYTNAETGKNEFRYMRVVYGDPEKMDAWNTGEEEEFPTLSLKLFGDDYDELDQMELHHGGGSDMGYAFANTIAGKLVNAVLIDDSIERTERCDINDLESAHQFLNNMLNDCNRIAIKSKRGPANFIIVTEDVWDKLKGYHNIPCDDGSIQSLYNGRLEVSSKLVSNHRICKVGKLHRMIDIYRYKGPYRSGKPEIPFSYIVSYNKDAIDSIFGLQIKEVNYVEGEEDGSSLEFNVRYKFKLLPNADDYIKVMD